MSSWSQVNLGQYFRRDHSNPDSQWQMPAPTTDHQNRSVKSWKVDLTSDTLLEQPTMVRQDIHLKITGYNGLGTPIGRKNVDLTVKVRDVLQNCQILCNLDLNSSRERQPVFSLTVVKDGAQVYSKRATLGQLTQPGFLNFSSDSQTSIRLRPPNQPY